MSEQRQWNIQLPDELGEVVETIQIVGSGTDEGAPTFLQISMALTKPGI